jgi:hypothetical protein
LSEKDVFGVWYKWNLYVKGSYMYIRRIRISKKDENIGFRVMCDIIRGEKEI